MDTSEKLINKIREGNLKPLPRWRFTLKDTVSWGIFIIAVAFGSLAFSVILFAIQQVDFNLIAHMSHSWLELILALMPFFWIISLVIFLVLAMISIRNSKKGYKLSSPSIIGFCVAISMLLGTLFFFSGGGRWLDRTFETNIQIYEGVQDNKIKLWTMPEDGYLSGTIIKVAGDSMTLEDFSGRAWTIDIADIDVVPAVTIEPGEKIKMIGEMTSSGSFRADKIRPWGGDERMKGKGKGRGRGW